MPSKVIPPLEELNVTELLDIYRRVSNGVRLKRSLPRERIIHLVQSEDAPAPEEIAQTMESRHRLEVWIGQNWDMIASQLPCKGENRGKCTIYQCPDGRHIHCYISAEKHFI